jgi:hypothetical protein
MIIEHAGDLGLEKDFATKRGRQSGPLCLS